MGDFQLYTWQGHLLSQRILSWFKHRHFSHEQLMMLSVSDQGREGQKTYSFLVEKCFLP